MIRSRFPAEVRTVSGDRMTNSERLKTVALLKLMESGLVENGETGTEERAKFEAFWCSFERNVAIAMENELRQQSGRNGSDEGGNDCDGCVEDPIDSRIPSLAFFSHFLFPFALGFFFALFLVFF